MVQTVAQEGHYYAKVIEDSVTPESRRLTTMEIKYPRFVHSEMLTHRDRARNSASSRAIPWPKMLARIENEPVIPLIFGSEQKGMQTGGEIDNPEVAERIWLEARDDAVKHARRLAELGVHKSICNRITEPWMWITVVMTATSWQNLFRLRVHPDAEIHIQKIATLMQAALDASKPMERAKGEWHLPYVDAQERADYANAGEGADSKLARISTARCARVSYLTHDGEHNPEADFKLFDRLSTGSGFGHWSPMEHPAVSDAPETVSGPYRGWTQFRKFFGNECAPEA